MECDPDRELLRSVPDHVWMPEDVEDVEDDQIFMAKRGIPYFNRGQSSKVLPDLCANTIQVSSEK